MNNNCLIGFYCPFLLPAILSSKIDSVFISSDCPASTLNGTKICGKMTAVLHSAQEYNVGALIMADCCNTSYGVYEYIKRSTLFHKVCYVSVPKIYNNEFDARLNLSLKKLSEWIGDELAPQRSPAIISGIVQASSSAPEWCTVTKELTRKISAADCRDIPKILIKNVCCPRLLSREASTVFPLTATENCKPREYAVCMNSVSNSI
jgi:hypothetical protein